MVEDWSNRRIVFLDIDGCITSVEDGSSFLLLNPESYRISESRLSLLMHLLEAADAMVVVSSNWRRFPDDGCWRMSPRIEFRNHLPELRTALGDRYFGDLPCDAGLTKSEALMLWGRLNGIDFSSLRFVIFDDDDSEGFGEVEEFRPHYIHCDPQTGITERQCRMALSMLSEGRF